MHPLRSNRFVLMLSDVEVAAIQDFRFSNRVGSKAGAVRRLIEKGLVAENKKGPAEVAASPSHGSSNPLTGNANERA